MLSWFAASTTRADDDTNRYFEQLRRRGLFRLAESVCYRELDRKDTTPAQQTQWTLELSRTLAAHAKYSAGKNRADLWKQAAAVVEEFLQKKENPPRIGWLRLQRCIVFVMQAEFLRWDAELFPYDVIARRKAIAALDTAEQELRTLESQLKRDGRALELRHTRYQLALTKIYRAEVTEAGSQQRATAASEAVTVLKPLVGGSRDKILTLNSRLLLAMAARLQNDPKTAGDRLKILLNLKPPTSLKYRILAEVVRNNLNAGKINRANGILTTYGKGGFLPGELAYLKVKTSIALWDAARKAGDENAAKQALERARVDVKNAERFHGGYWGYRCRAVFDFLKAAKLHGPELAASMRRAEVFVREKKTDAAIREYHSASKLAAQSKQTNVAVEMAFTAASLEMQSNRFEDAAKSYAGIVNEHLSDKRAAEADLLAAYCLGRLYDARRTKSRRLTYTQALVMHRKRFAKSPTAHEAAWMLAGLHDYRNQTSESLRLYLTIPADHTRGLSARVEAARCFEQILSRIRELKQAKELKTWEASAASHLHGFIAGFPKSPAIWNRQQADVALRTARIELNRATPDYRKAEPILSRVLASAKSTRSTSKLTQNERNWWTAATNNARQLQVLALAGSGKTEDAARFLASLSNAGPAEVLPVLDGLMQLGESTPQQLQRELGALQLQAAKQLDAKRGQLKPPERKWLDRCLAQAYSSTGNTGNAVEKFERLLAKSPKNKQYLRSAATLLGKSKTREVLLKSRSYWQRLGALERPGTPGWFEARYEAAAVSFRLSEFADCVKTLRKTRLIFPTLGGAKMKARFDKLEAAAKAKM